MEFMACILNVHNNLKTMTRYIYSFCLLFGFVGLPAQAKWTVPATNTTTLPSKVTGQSPVGTPASAPAVAAKPTEKVPATALTSDTMRSTTMLAARNHSSPTLPAYLVGEKPILGTLVGGGAAPAPAESNSDRNETLDTTSPDSHLARLTAYWAAEGDYYTGRGISATGVRLHDGLCAVDPAIIPYGSVVEIAGMGKFLAVDTGTAVIERIAAREGGHTAAEKHALVIDIFFESRRDGERFEAEAAKFAKITWWTPGATNTLARARRSLFADEDWMKIQSKQL